MGRKVTQYRFRNWEWRYYGVRGAEVSKFPECWLVRFVCRVESVPLFLKKDDKWFLDRSSAKPLWVPGKWTADGWNWKLASVKNKPLSVCSNILSWLYLLFNTETTAVLSQWAITLPPDHSWPQTRVAIMIGISSLMAMCILDVLSSQASWNHFWLCHAPQPHTPDASEVSVNSVLPGWITSAAPFQWAANVFHHFRSDRNSALSRMWWCRCLALLRRAIARLRNERPGRITLHAWCRTPISTSRSLRVHALRFSHWSRMCNSLLSLSSGSLNSCLIVSIIIHKNTIIAVGPSCLSMASGMPSSAHTLFSINSWFRHAAEALQSNSDYIFQNITKYHGGMLC